MFPQSSRGAATEYGSGDSRFRNFVNVILHVSFDLAIVYEFKWRKSFNYLEFQGNSDSSWDLFFTVDYSWIVEKYSWKL